MRKLATIRRIDELNPIEGADEFYSKRDIHDVNEEGIYDEWEVKWLIEEMADDFLHNRDGWELNQTWTTSGLTFVVWDDNKNFVGKYTVILEYEPTFMVYKDNE